MDNEPPLILRNHNPLETVKVTQLRTMELAMKKVISIVCVALLPVIIIGYSYCVSKLSLSNLIVSAVALIAYNTLLIISVVGLMKKNRALVVIAGNVIAYLVSDQLIHFLLKSP